MEDVLERDYDALEYEHPVDDINRTAGVGRPAGVYWLDGGSIIAGHDTPAEARLVAAGAVLVATLRFDPDPAERMQRGRAVRRLTHLQVRSLTGPAGSN
ncbi:MAG: hypothetical protein WEF86_06120 [Gemmatimonadota bacterium]